MTFGLSFSPIVFGGLIAVFAFASIYMKEADDEFDIDTFND